MDLNKISKIANIFFININDIVYINRNNHFFTLKFSYKEVNIEILNSSDYIHKNYYDITIKKDLIDHECIATSFATLLAYFNEESFNLKYTFNNMIDSLIILKQFIDSDKLFFEYFSKDMTQRYMHIDNKFKQLPIIINSNYEIESELIFGTNHYKIISNQPIYK